MRPPSVIHVQGHLTDRGRVYYNCPMCKSIHTHGYYGRTKSTHCSEDKRQVCIHVKGEIPDCKK